MQSCALQFLKLLTIQSKLIKNNKRQILEKILILTWMRNLKMYVLKVIAEQKDAKRIHVNKKFLITHLFSKCPNLVVSKLINQYRCLMVWKNVFHPPGVRKNLAFLQSILFFFVGRVVNFKYFQHFFTGTITFSFVINSRFL